MDRREFLKGLAGILAASAAPAVVRSDSLMRIVPQETTILIGQVESFRFIRSHEYGNALAFSEFVSGPLHEDARKFLPPGTPYEIRTSDYGSVVRGAWYYNEHMPPKGDFIGSPVLVRGSHVYHGRFIA